MTALLFSFAQCCPCNLLVCFTHDTSVASHWTQLKAFSCILLRCLLQQTYDQLGWGAALVSVFVNTTGAAVSGEEERLGEGDRDRRFCVSISLVNVDKLCAAKRLSPGGDIGGEAIVQSESEGGVRGGDLCGGN
jgi:hypothetical protein